MLKQFVIIAAAAFLTACGGGGDASPAFDAQVDKQKIVPVAANSLGTDRTVYGDVFPSPTRKMSWVELIGLTGTIDSTQERPLQALIDGSDGRAPPLAEMLRGQDPSTILLFSFGHQEALLLDTKLEQFKDSLREAVRIARVRGRTPEIRGLHHVTGFNQPTLVRRDQFDKAAQDVAAELGVRFYDVGSLPWTPEDLMPDGYHPTLAYSTRIGQFLRSQMQ